MGSDRRAGGEGEVGGEEIGRGDKRRRSRSDEGREERRVETV